MSKLGLNQELIAKARASAHKVAADVQALSMNIQQLQLKELFAVC